MIVDHSQSIRDLHSFPFRIDNATCLIYGDGLLIVCRQDSDFSSEIKLVSTSPSSDKRDLLLNCSTFGSESLNVQFYESGPLDVPTEGVSRGRRPEERPRYSDVQLL